MLAGYRAAKAAPDPETAFIAALRQSPTGKAIMTDIAVAEVAARQGKLDQLRALDRQAAPDSSILYAAILSAKADVDAAEAALKRAREIHAAAVGRHIGTHCSRSIEREQLEAGLREGSSPLIDDFLAEMHIAIRTARKSSAHTFQAEPNIVTRILSRVLVSNSRSVVARLDAIRTAMAAAEALRLEADQSIVPGRLQVLRAGLPAIGDMEASPVPGKPVIIKKGR